MAMRICEACDGRGWTDGACSPKLCVSCGGIGIAPMPDPSRPPAEQPAEPPRVIIFDELWSPYPASSD